MRIHSTLGSTIRKKSPNELQYQQGFSTFFIVWCPSSPSQFFPSPGCTSAFHWRTKSLPCRLPHLVFDKKQAMEKPQISWKTCLYIYIHIMYQYIYICILLFQCSVSIVCIICIMCIVSIVCITCIRSYSMYVYIYILYRLCILYVYSEYVYIYTYSMYYIYYIYNTYT